MDDLGHVDVHQWLGELVEQLDNERHELKSGMAKLADGVRRTVEHVQRADEKSAEQARRLEKWLTSGFPGGGGAGLGIGGAKWTGDPGMTPPVEHTPGGIEWNGDPGMAPALPDGGPEWRDPGFAPKVEPMPFEVEPYAPAPHAEPMPYVVGPDTPPVHAEPMPYVVGPDTPEPLVEPVGDDGPRA